MALTLLRLAFLGMVLVLSLANTADDIQMFKPSLDRLSLDSDGGNIVYTALMTFYNATGGPDWNSSDNWGQGSNISSICTWEGINCSPVPQSVTGITLLNNNLIGTLPVAISQITSLEALALTSNSLYGSIPKEIFEMATLQTLNVNGNSLTSWPEGVTSCPALEVLFFGENRFTGSIPSFLTHCSLLTVLNGASNKLTGTIDPAFGSICLGMGTFNFASNSLSGTLPASFANWGPNITTISLNVNLLEGTLPSSWRYFSQLSKLNLQNNRLDGTLPNEWSEMSSMKQFRVDSNNLGGTLPASYSNWTLLTGLGAQNNHLEGTLPPEWSQLSHLDALYLGYNQLSGTIPSSYEDLIQLRNLIVAANNLHGPLPLFFFSHTSQMGNLDLSMNQFSGTLPSRHSPSLSSLKLFQNQLEGTIPAGLLTGSLQLFDACANQLSGTIPSTFATLNIIEIFAVSDNQLSGTIPVIQPFNSLEKLVFSNNAIEGTLPTALFLADSDEPTSSLTFLAAENNRLEGTLPVELSGSSLVTMLLSYNQLEGDLPIFPSTMQTVLLAGNNFQGTFDNLQLILFPLMIDLRSNPGIVGDIPFFIRSSLTIQFLYVDGTNVRSALGAQLPEGLTFLTGGQTAYTQQDGDSIVCPKVILTASERATISVDPDYFQYSGCYCGPGLSIDQVTGSCEKCPLGFFNQGQEPSCKPCAQGYYSDSKGASSCKYCQLPFYLVVGHGSGCIYLWLVYLGVAAGVVAIILSLSLGILLAGGIGYVAIRSISRLREVDAKKLTELIGKIANQEIPADLLIHYSDIVRIKRIGAGSFSQVYLGRWKQTQVAVKELVGIQYLNANLEAEAQLLSSGASSSTSANSTNQRSSAGLRSGSDESFEEHNEVRKLVAEFRSEVLVMSRLHHPNVILLVGACSQFPNFCIVTEYLENGSLYEKLHAPDAAVHVHVTLQYNWLLQTASGMAYLHDQGLIHRDLKSPNVLLDQTNQAKLCDFGLTRLVGDQMRAMTQNVGSILWMAPEIFLHEDYSYAADVYSWGILAWEIMSPGQDLYPHKSTYAISTLVVKGERPSLPESWPKCLWSTVQSCYEQVPENRPNFEGIVESIAQLMHCDVGTADSCGTGPGVKILPSVTPRVSEGDMSEPLLG
jgi:serine/threonine protein kinase